MAASGPLTADAVSVGDAHKELVAQPQIDMWPDNRMEVLLPQQPTPAITHGSGSDLI